jgi:hypothetical protein
VDESTPAFEVSRRRELRREPYRIDFAKAWTKAKARIKAASGLDIEREARTIQDPVQRARRTAEIASPFDMRLSLILGVGCEPDELERDKSGARLMLEAAHKRMSIVGLRSGEVQEHELSDRFQDFFARFQNFRASRALPARDDGDSDA